MRACRACPSTSGRTPRDRARRSCVLDVSATSEYAPSTCFNASISAPRRWRYRLFAIRWMITSVSDVAWNKLPLYQLWRSVYALVRLPLCADRQTAEIQIGEQRLHIA